jgi:diguanylate cyclase (GGDEF)-like protein
MARNRFRTERKVVQALRWSVFLVGMLGCLAISLGRYEPGLRYSLLSLTLAFLLLLSFLLTAKGLVRKTAAEFSLEQAAFILLGCALVWVLFRVGSSHAPQTILLPAFFCAWLVATLRPRLLPLPLVAIVLMESGLWAGGFQNISALAGNLAACAFAALGLLLFVKSRTYLRRIRREVARAQKAETDQTRARDLGLLPTAANLLAALPGPEIFSDPEVEGRSAAARIDAGFSAQLELMRHTLGAASAALLWPDTEGREYRLRGIATLRRDINSGPYQIGAGITGALLKSGEAISLAPVPASLGALPYYQKQSEVGAILAVRLPESDGDTRLEEGRRIPPILCVDRSEPRPWTEEEKRSLHLAARKLALDVASERHCQTMAREHGALQRVCIALRELNGVADLDQVLQATVKAVRFLVHVDFVAISLVQEYQHKVAVAEGAGAEKLLGRSFPLEEGLVGRTLKLNRPLPANARCQGPMQVFGRDYLLTDYASLLVVPLQREEGTAVGALTVAAAAPEVLSPARQEILRLIAAQVAVKIDLGRTHQQLNQLATTDGLTGLLNHRTFQHGFNMMLQRESRRQGSLSLLLCDIDHFKKINDAYGHPFGDAVLQGVASILGKAARRVDLTARYGGEEFALLLEGAGEKGALKVAARIRKEIENMVFRHVQGPVRVTISVGVAVSPEHGTDKALLLSRADQALYQAKKQGRNRVVVWRQEQTDSSSRDPCP